MAMGAQAEVSTHLQKCKAVGVDIVSVSKSFGDNHVLTDLSLEVYPGETLLIIGKSGSGKSVLLKHIIGLLTPDSGRILIGGMDVADPELNKEHRLAMVFQSAALFNSLTTAENIALYHREHRLYSEEEIAEIVKETLEIVELEGKEDIMPSELSGGMKKRVAIARALAMSPELILYDEPTGELDPMMTRMIGDEIIRLRNKIEVTQIVVTHDVELAAQTADRVAILDSGHILEVGTLSQIRSSGNPKVLSFFDRWFNGGVN